MKPIALRATSPAFILKANPPTDGKKPRKTFEERFAAKVRTAGPDECWHWLGAPDTCSLGYGRISRDGVKLYAHRAAYEIAFGPIPAGMVVMHKCDCPSCNNPRHLEAAFPADNTNDMVAKGRQRRNLTKAEVIEIDRLDREHGTYWTHARLASRFKVTESSIRRLLAGSTWSKLTGRMTGPARKRATANAAKTQTVEARAA